MRGGASEHVAPVHLAQRVGDELDAGPVGIAEVHRHPAVHLVVHPGLLEPVDQAFPVRRVDRDRAVMEAAEHLGVRPDVEAGEVEKASRFELPMSKKKCEEP